MELDELKVSWQQLDRRIADLTAINHKLLNEAISRKARWRLLPVFAGSVMNIVIGAIFRRGVGRILERPSGPPGRGGRGHRAAPREHRARRDRRSTAGADAADRLHAAGRRDPAGAGDSAGVRGAFISRGVVRLLAARAGCLGCDRHGVCGSGPLGTCVRLSAGQFRGVPRGRTRAATAALLGAPSRRAGWPRASTAFLVSHSIARAKAAIAEIDGFAGR